MRLDDEETFLKFAPVVELTARSMAASRPELQYDDLYQDGCIGLLEAIQRYRHDSGVPFAAYARFRIKGAMIDGLRHTNWNFRKARSTDERRRRSREVSLDEPGAVAVADRPLSTDYLLLGAAGRVLEALPERWKQVLRLHYVEGLTFVEVAAELGLTVRWVRLVHSTALERLRAGLRRHGPDDDERLVA